MVPVNVTLFENRIFADVIKMRSTWIRVGLQSNDWCLYKRKRERFAYRHRGYTEGRRPCEEGGQRLK